MVLVVLWLGLWSFNGARRARVIGFVELMKRFVICSFWLKGGCLLSLNWGLVIYFLSLDRKKVTKKDQQRMIYSKSVLRP